jgi:mRNA interferase MazF
VIYEAFDVVVVPFPFTDRDAGKRRPALVLSREAWNAAARHVVLAMITSAKNPPWPLDIRISAEAAVGLKSPSVVRMKLFTLDARLVLRKAGRLAKEDQEAVARTLQQALGVLWPSA